jgi:WD40 repeat protein
MPKITHLADVQLTHDARVYAGGPSNHVAVLSLEGPSSLISPDFKTVQSFTAPIDSVAAALSADGSLLAVAAPDGITVMSTSNFEKVHHLNDAFLACLFSGDLFWTASRLDGETIILDAWKPGDWSRVARVKVADPNGESSVSLFPHFDRNSVVLWAAGGQDGQSLFWATLEGEEIQVTHFDLLDETAPPSFSPDGETFLVASEGMLHCYSYPEGPEQSVLEELDDDQDPVGYYATHIGPHHALVASMNGCLYPVELEEMSVGKEIKIPNLGKRDYLEFLLPLSPGKIALIYRQPGGDAKGNVHLLEAKA